MQKHSIKPGRYIRFSVVYNILFTYLFDVYIKINFHLFIYGKL